MPYKIFISYSRRQAPFVDHLVADLENQGYSIWLDYKSLVPAKPWFDQIQAGLEYSEIVTLVVSREAFASDYAK